MSYLTKEFLQRFTFAFAIVLSLSIDQPTFAGANAAEYVPDDQEVLALSWEEFSRDTEALIEPLREKGPWKGVIAIARGGLVPAAILANKLDIRKVDTMSIASYNERNRGDLKVLKGSAIPGEGEGWLVIDDLVDSGRTLEHVRKVFPKAYYAVVYAKPSGLPKVDTHVKKVAQDTWVIFPWEEKEG